MAEVIFPSNELTISVPGTVQVFAKTYSRKIVITNMMYDIYNRQVIVEGIIKFYNQNGLEEATSAVAKPYAISILASNDEFCEVETGKALCKVANKYTDHLQTQLNPALLNADGTEKNYAKQFDWFYNLGQNVPTIVNDMIEQFILESLQAGKFD